MLGRVVSNYFNNSLSSLVSAFTADHSISEKELEELERLVESAKRKNS
ncbi:MAG: BlaI/MecI/CopY family transcriptional regulator [Bacteroidales bacterium]|nr:BlaI/MecI/CopY family transcriptional regulator [Bacteroidales bacterium]